jgi:hypothetical protein
MTLTERLIENLTKELRKYERPATAAQAELADRLASALGYLRIRARGWGQE